MTVADIAQRLSLIAEVADNPEEAHVEQDKLLFAVLRAISRGASQPAALAAEALKVADINFPRWYA